MDNVRHIPVPKNHLRAYMYLAGLGKAIHLTSEYNFLGQSN